MTASSQNVDPLDALLDFSEYDNVSYQSPTLSPATTNKNAFTARPASTVTSPTIPTTQALNGPSHQYELYKQQTGIVPGALASTLAVQSAGYAPLDLDYLGMSPGEDLFDFNTAPSQGSGSLNPSDMDMDFDSPTNEPFFFESTVNPSALGGQESPSMSPQTVLPAQTGNVGRLWPGMHSQAALAKAQAQQRQQQQIMQQQRQPAMAGKPRNKSNQPTDPIVEQKITQLLNSMRAKPSSPDQQGSVQLLNVPRPKKDEDDMDEDERLLASEEGKKLSSKERRQLRNKVSARAFRSRRKEYITQLEAEIATKVNENGDLRAQNRALMEENKRLSDLTRMLLSSPSFSNFLDHLSSNPSAVPQPSPVAVKQETPQPQQERRKPPKDINPFSATQQVQQQRIGMTIIPEQNMDFSMLSLDNDGTFSFQPQVFALATPAEMPASIDTNILSGKTSNFVGEHFDSADEKVELPAVERPAEKLEPAAREEPPRNEEFESDPEFALYHSSPEAERETPASLETEDLSRVDIFGGVEPEKVLARYELLDADEEERTAVLSLAKVQRISDRLESVRERIERLTDL